ncbi:histone-fold-containing protein [Aspergillus carlsbadensis]|nr:histone-fold-containing protein [Aspergillus carlsbadensis]
MAPARPGIATLARYKRHYKVKDNIMGITRPVIRRLARRGGVYRIRKEIYNEIRKVIKERLTEILRHIVLILDSARTPRLDRKMITTRDVCYALNRMGSTIYGF